MNLLILIYLLLFGLPFYFVGLSFFYRDIKIYDQFLKNKLKFFIGLESFFIITNLVLLIINIFSSPNIYKNLVTFILITLLVMFLLIFKKTVVDFKKRIAYQENLLRIRLKVKENLEITIHEFYIAYSKQKINGVYILFNKTKDLYYVGKSQNIISRVKNHIEGRGNAHLFADLKYGDEFSIHLIPYDSKFYNLSEQEKYYVRAFDSYNNGYNKTRGG